MANCKSIKIDGVSYTVYDESAHTAIDELNDRVDTEITNRESEDNTIKEQIASLQARKMSGLYDMRECVFIGDSYLAMTPSWGDLLATKLADRVNAHHNFAFGGSGYLTAGSFGTFYSNLTNGGAVYNAVQDYKNNVTLVIIEGGINDGEPGTDEMSAAVVQTIEAAKALFVNADIVCVYNWFSGPYPITQYRGILQGCAITGAGFVKSSFCWLWNTEQSKYFGSDNIHPNADGTELAVSCLAQWLVTGFSPWPGTPQKKTLEGGADLYWEIDQNDILTIGIFGTNTGDATDNIGTLPAAITPRLRTISTVTFSSSNNQVSGGGIPKINFNNMYSQGKISTNLTSVTGVSLEVYLHLPAIELGNMWATL